MSLPSRIAPQNVLWMMWWIVSCRIRKMMASVRDLLRSHSCRMENLPGRRRRTAEQSRTPDSHPKVDSAGCHRMLALSLGIVEMQIVRHHPRTSAFLCSTRHFQQSCKSSAVRRRGCCLHRVAIDSLCWCMCFPPHWRIHHLTRTTFLDHHEQRAV